MTNNYTTPGDIFGDALDMSYMLCAQRFTELSHAADGTAIAQRLVTDGIRSGIIISRKDDAHTHNQRVSSAVTEMFEASDTVESIEVVPVEDSEVKEMLGMYRTFLRKKKI